MLVRTLHNFVGFTLQLCRIFSLREKLCFLSNSESISCMVGNLMHNYENEKSAFDYIWLVFFSDVYNFSSMSWKCWWWKPKLHWVRWGNALTMHFGENCIKNNSARHQESLLENLLIMNILDNIEDRYRMILKSFWWHDLQTYAQYLFQFIYVLVYSPFHVIWKIIFVIRTE